MGRIRLALLLLLLLTVAPLQAQGPTPAVVQQAIDALLASNAVITGNWTCTGTCTGFGGGGGGGVWGTITGTLSNQTDLQTALNTKVTTSGSPSSGYAAVFSAASGITGTNDFTFSHTSPFGDPGGHNFLTASGRAQNVDGWVTAYSLYPSGPHTEEPFVKAIEGVNGNQMSLTALGTGYDNSDLIDLAEAGLVWANTDAGMVILSSFVGPIRFATGGFTNDKEFLRLNDTAVLGIGPFPSLSTMDLGIYRNAAGVLEINNGTAGTFRDLKARDVFIDGEKCPSMQTAPISVDSNGKLVKGSCAP